jgi:calcineurin-like phosphoesterase family protein
MTRWVSSDWHLFHKNIRKFEPCRPENFEQVLIENARAVLRPGDEFWFLGDMSFGSQTKTEEIIGDLLSKVDAFLIEGNHDSSRTKAHFARLGFKEVFPLSVVLGNKLLSHYPLSMVDERYHDRAEKLKEVFERENCAIHVHGHTHGKHSSHPKCVNVSCEVTGLRPVDLDTITLAPPWRPT